MATAYQPIASAAPVGLFRQVRDGAVGPAGSSESGSRINNSIVVAQGVTRAVNRVPILVSDDIISGSLTEAGRMSPVRRFFCLLVTFDVLFIGLLWVITVIVSGRDIELALHQQVIEYTIHSSMFDCVMCALVRFFICILFYAFFNLNHWWPIAFTTAGTSAFLIAKVFEYEWSKVNMLTFEVTLVLLSFVLAWGELWFLDGRVLPLESKAKEIYANSEWNLNNSAGDHERAPLLPPLAGRSAMLQRYMDGVAETVSVTGSNFYSLAHHSDDEHDTDLTMDKKKWMATENRELKQRAKDLPQTAWRILNKPCWKVESVGKEPGEVVESLIEKDRKILKVTATLNIPARILLEELFYKVESSASWNPLVEECKIVQTLDSNTDVLYQVCPSHGGGSISSRDFVLLRRWELIDGHYVSAHVSVDYENVPIRVGRVRGESGTCCFAIEQCDDEPNKCELLWLLDTDLKLSLPKFLLDKALVASCFEFLGYLKARISEIRKELHLDTSTASTQFSS